MKTTQQFKFIAAKFTADEAKEILSDLLNHKIRFHTMKNFSNEERFGKPIKGSQKRIEELKKSRDKILQMVTYAAETNTSLKVESTITIALEA